MLKASINDVMSIGPFVSGNDSSFFCSEYRGESTVSQTHDCIGYMQLRQRDPRNGHAPPLPPNYHENEVEDRIKFWYEISTVR